jgi:hypothetical protein
MNSFKKIINSFIVKFIFGGIEAQTLNLAPYPAIAPKCAVKDKACFIRAV